MAWIKARADITPDHRPGHEPKVRATLELYDGMDESALARTSEASDWIERVMDAASQFECVDAEVAGGLGR